MKSACLLIFEAKGSGQGTPFCRSCLGILVTFLAVSCSSHDTSWDPIMHGTIEYPFVERTNPLGHNGPQEKFVVRSTVGETEYTMEIPGAAKDYDIEVPLADLGKLGGKKFREGDPEKIGNPQLTDRELVAAMPKLPEPEDRGLVDSAYGVGELGGPEQSPSLSFRIAKINELYLDQQYEFALVEINNLLAYYPSSVRLFKMKGTILIKLRHLKLAEIAWSRALELSPNDTSLSRALMGLRRQIEISQRGETAEASKASQGWQSQPPAPGVRSANASNLKPGKAGPSANGNIANGIVPRKLENGNGASPTNRKNGSKENFIPSNEGDDLE